MASTTKKHARTETLDEVKEQWKEAQGHWAVAMCQTRDCVITNEETLQEFVRLKREELRLQASVQHLELLVAVMQRDESPAEKRARLQPRYNVIAEEVRSLLAQIEAAEGFYREHRTKALQIHAEHRRLSDQGTERKIEGTLDQEMTKKINEAYNASLQATHHTKVLGDRVQELRERLRTLLCQHRSLIEEYNRAASFQLAFSDRCPVCFDELPKAPGELHCVKGCVFHHNDDGCVYDGAFHVHRGTQAECPLLHVPRWYFF